MGNITRGTTNPNRLRRVDRWIAIWPGLRNVLNPLVVDIGYGQSAVTTVELRKRLLSVRADVEVLGLEIDPRRVTSARDDLDRWEMTGIYPPISFDLGGFDFSLPPERQAVIIRAFNVLRQYDESDVDPAWMYMRKALHPEGVLIDGTCDEIGRVATWIALNRAGPMSLTLSLRVVGLEAPSIAAQRLPKALIHRNLPGEPVHALLCDLDKWWAMHSPLATFGATQRWIATVESMREAGWPVLSGRSRWRLGEITIDWAGLVRA